MILSGKGATYKEMARALDLSVKTIETYMRSIYMKTGAVNMVALYSLIKG
jgi:DNA-binding CsgD family transcriptional regulator